MNPSMKIITRSAGAWLLLRVLDIGTTILCATQIAIGGFQESNPWASNPDGSFNLAHGIGVTGCWFAALVFIGAALWYAFRPLDHKTELPIAAVIAVSPAWLWGISTVLPAIVHNLMTYFGWRLP